jgi:hypothetical protein
LFSLLYVPHPFIIPGGRFREFYYWLEVFDLVVPSMPLMYIYYRDSYWILKGLLMSEMFQTAKGMIQNFAYMIEKYVRTFSFDEQTHMNNTVMDSCQMVVAFTIYYDLTLHYSLQWFTIIISPPVILIYCTNCCQY